VALATLTVKLKVSVSNENPERYSYGIWRANQDIA